MKFPSKGSRLFLEGLGTPLFVKGPDMDAETPTVWVKYEGAGLDEGYGGGIVDLTLKEFEEKRIYPQQLSWNESLADRCEREETIGEIRKNYGT